MYEKRCILNETVFKAARLIYMGLQPKITPSKDREYKDLIQLAMSSDKFRDMVQTVAQGLSLYVVDISERGIILSPEDLGSLFKMTLTEYRRELGGDDTDAKPGLIALVQVAIAATFFPTAESLDDDDWLSESKGVRNFDNVLVGMCEKVASEDDPEAVSPFLRQSGETVLTMPEIMPDAKKLTLKSRTGAIGIVVKHLEENRMVKRENTTEGETWFPTYRYQQLLRRRAGGGLFEICHRIASLQRAGILGEDV